MMRLSLCSEDETDTALAQDWVRIVRKIEFLGEQSACLWRKVRKCVKRDEWMASVVDVTSSHDGGKA